MVYYCCAWGCSNKRIPNWYSFFCISIFIKTDINYETYKKNISNIFSFPLKNKECTSKWLENIKRKGFVPTKYSRLCSKHFLPTDFLAYNKENDRLCFNDNAIPTVFNSSNEEVHCQNIIENDGVEVEDPLNLSMPKLHDEFPTIPQRSENTKNIYCIISRTSNYT